MTFFADDRQFMSRALQLAERGRYTARPNPCVGCVIVSSFGIVAEGWHYRAGEAHAEAHALQALTAEQLRGATVYVTLEPCSHTGKTGPCADALVSAGVARVVYGMQDPNPQVAGRGLSQLKKAGIIVDGPLMLEQAQKVNPGFISRMQRGRPWVRCKLAASLDGRTAMASGESQWITGVAARQDVQQWRARSCAVITGIGSIQQDNSRLTLRSDMLKLDNVHDVLCKPPLRVVLDTHLSIDMEAAVLQEAGQVVIFTYHEIDERRADTFLNQFSSLTIERVDKIPQGGISLEQVLACLADKYECNEVLIEAGARLSGACLQAGLIDELILYQAPVLMGNDAKPLFEWSIQAMADKRELAIVDQRAIGKDWRTIASIK
jgi:diaminohydroxyphosphoribosylaminopyrimidine deaminase/5-amino-6-(5-phosphoribosylamino)uracil reductase